MDKIELFLRDRGVDNNSNLAPHTLDLIHEMISDYVSESNDCPKSLIGQYAILINEDDEVETALYIWGQQGQYLIVQNYGFSQEDQYADVFKLMDTNELKGWYFVPNRQTLECVVNDYFKDSTWKHHF